MTDFEQIYITYFGDVYRYLRKLTGDESLAEELTGETFFKAIASIDSFHGDCSLKVWLCQIGKNCWYSYLRKNGRVSSVEEAPEPVSELNIEELFAGKDEVMRLHRILHELEEPYKEVFSLRVFGELSFEQIGRLFGKTQNWACVTFYRAKKKIRDAAE